MDAKVQVALAAGIAGERLTRWSDTPMIERKGDDDDHVFYLEGPILSNDMEDFYSDAKGFVTPLKMRQFLSENKGKDIEIRINSPGGQVFEANSMLSDLLQHEQEITVRIIGACFSAAADFLCIPGAKRIAMPGSLVMIHNAWTIAGGDSKQLQKVVNRLEKMNQQCIQRFSENCNLDADQLARFMDEETFFTDHEAFDVGLVDAVFEDESKSKEEESADEESEDARQAVERANITIAHRLATIL